MLRESFILVFILLLAFLNFWHVKGIQVLPVHVDEWANIELAEFHEQGLFTGLEVGYHSVLNFLHGFGFSYFFIVRFFPLVTVLGIVLVFYLLGSRHGFGLEAAFFAALIPTTDKLLGFGFCVAVALGLLLYFFFFWLYQSGARAFSFFFPLIILLIHPPTGIFALASFTLLWFKDREWENLIITCISCAFLLVIFISLVPENINILYGGPPVTEVFNLLPLPFLSLSFIGLYLCARDKIYSGLLFMLLLVLGNNLFYMVTKFTVFNLPERNLFYVVVLLLFFAGHGLKTLLNAFYRGDLFSKLQLNFIIMILVCSGFLLVVRNTHYISLFDEEYKIISSYQNEFTGKLVSNPSVGYALNKMGYDVLACGVRCPGNNVDSVRFLYDGCVDNSFIAANNVGAIFSRGVCNPENFTHRGRGLWTRES